MKYFISSSIIGALLVVCPIASAEEPAWLTDFDKALAAAEEKNAPILVNFSGSDWCYWCQKLEKEIFSKKAFLDFASDKLTLFQADFPRSKRLPKEIRKQNEALAKKYGIIGFPTVVLLNANGDVIARTGYQSGGPDAYIKHINKLLENS